MFCLLLAAWFVNSLKKAVERVTEKWFGEMVEVPQQMKDTKENVEKLEETLVKFATEWEADRKESHLFRVALATTLAEHGATIKSHGEQLASIRTWPPGRIQ